MFFSKKNKEEDLRLKEVQEEVVKCNIVLDTSRKTIRTLKEEIDGLKSKRKIELEDIKHMVKMREERNEIKFEKLVMDLEKEKFLEIGTVKDTYRDKLEGRLTVELDNMKDMYGQVLERLPNITGKLKGNL